MVDLSITAASVVPGSNATVEKGTAGATITAGQAVYKDGTTSKFKLADANGSGTRSVYGIALNGASDGQPLAVVRAGDVTIGATLTAGVAYYLSENAGGIAPIADIGSGDDPIIIGMAKSTSVLTVDVQDPGVTL